jgi:CheY-like chemotaxis protein
MKFEPNLIVLIEDTRSDADLIIGALLRIAKPTIVRIEDGSKAVGQLIEQPLDKLPSLIILDWRLPKLSGAEVLQKLKASARMKLVPVVVLTSSEEETDLREAYAGGANTVIVKPISYDALKRTMKSILHYWREVNFGPCSTTAP